MERMKEGLLRKVRSMVSVIYGIVCWVTRISSAMQTPKALPSHQHLQLGLGALICSTSQNPNRHAWIIHSSTVSSSSSSPCFLSSPWPLKLSAKTSSSSSWLLTMGDLIGTESGVYMSSSEETLTEGLEKTNPYSYSQRNRNQQRKTKSRREYPPPIPSLARTENLTGRMPWVLTRHYFDGRLILREERVKHYEYFEASRENGRLVLNLVPLDHTIECSHYNEEQEKKLQIIREENESIDEDGEAENDEDSNVGSSSDDRDDGNNKQNQVVDQMEQKGSTIILASSMPVPIRVNKPRDTVSNCSPSGLGSSLLGLAISSCNVG